MFFQRPDGIVRGGPVRLDQYGGDGGSQHDRQRREINPDFDRSFVGEVFEPPVDDAVSYRYGDNETRQYDAHVNFVEHPEDLADSRAVDLPNPDLFATVLGFEQHEAEYPYDRDQDRQQAEQGE